MALLRATGLKVRSGDGGADPLAGPVDLSLEPGEVLAIEGPSGAGKTTLLRALARLDALAEGDVALEDHGTSFGPPVPAFRRRVVYLPQQPPPLPGTVADSLGHAFAFRTARAAHYDPERARTLLARLGLPVDVARRRLTDLSVGEAQRVSLVRALLVDPEVLLLDEPTSALDPDSREATAKLLAEWLEGGARAAVLVTHDAAFADRLATARRRLEDGTLGPEEAP